MLKGSQQNQIEEEDLDAKSTKLEKQLKRLQKEKAVMLRTQRRVQQENETLQNQAALIALIQKLNLSLESTPPSGTVEEEPPKSLRYQQMRKRMDAKKSKHDLASSSDPATKNQSNHSNRMYQ